MKARPILDWSDDGELKNLEELLPERAKVEITAKRDGRFTIAFELELPEPEYTLLDRAASRANTATGPLLRRAVDRGVQELLDSERHHGRRILDD